MPSVRSVTVVDLSAAVTPHGVMDPAAAARLASHAAGVTGLVDLVIGDAFGVPGTGIHELARVLRHASGIEVRGTNPAAVSTFTRWLESIFRNPPEDWAER
jgi:hypothetical protein